MRIDKLLRGETGDALMYITPHRSPACEDLDSPYDIKLILCRKLHSFLGKSTKTAATKAALFDSNMQQIVCRLGLHPRPHWGSLQRSPDPLAVFRGPTSKGRGGERRGWEGEGDEKVRPLSYERKRKLARLCMMPDFMHDQSTALLVDVTGTTSSGQLG